MSQWSRQRSSAWHESGGEWPCRALLHSMPVCFCPLQRLRAMRLLSISSNSDNFSMKEFLHHKSHK